MALRSTGVVWSMAEWVGDEEVEGVEEGAVEDLDFLDVLDFRVMTKGAHEHGVSREGEMYSEPVAV